MKRHLAKVRKDRIAFDRGEINEDINAIGAPIFNHENRPVAAVVIVGPSTRVKCNNQSPFVVELKKTALKISAQLFHPYSRSEIVNF